MHINVRLIFAYILSEHNTVSHAKIAQSTEVS